LLGESGVGGKVQSPKHKTGGKQLQEVQGVYTNWAWKGVKKAQPKIL
jgi:hypothetical protein